MQLVVLATSQATNKLDGRLGPCPSIAIWQWKQLKPAAEAASAFTAADRHVSSCLTHLDDSSNITYIFTVMPQRSNLLLQMLLQTNGYISIIWGISYFLHMLVWVSILKDSIMNTLTQFLVHSWISCGTTMGWPCWWPLCWPWRLRHCVFTLATQSICALEHLPCGCC